MRGDRARHVVTHRDRRALGHQQKCRGLSDDFGVADHHDLEAVQVEAGGLDQLDRRGRRARRQRQIVVDDVADRRGVHALDVLERMDRRRPASGRECAWAPGRCRMMPSTSGSSFMATMPGLALLLGECAGPPRVLEAETDLRRGVRLAAHVDGGLLLLTDVDRDEASDAMGRGRPLRAPPPRRECGRGWPGRSAGDGLSCPRAISAAAERARSMEELSLSASGRR